MNQDLFSQPPQQPQMPQPAQPQPPTPSFFQPGVAPQPVQQVGSAPMAQPAVTVAPTPVQPASNYLAPVTQPKWIMPMLIVVLVLVVLAAAGLCALVFFSMK